MTNLDLDDLDPNVRNHYRSILLRQQNRNPMSKSRTIAAAAAAFILGASLLTAVGVFAATTTVDWSAGTSKNIICPTPISNANINADSETVSCAPRSTTTTTVPVTTTTVAPTTTTVPPTTTTTTQPSGSKVCTSTGNGGSSNLPPGGGWPANPALSESNGFNTYTENNVFDTTDDHQTICGTGPTNMTVSATDTDQNGSVDAYPDIAQQSPDSTSPLSSLTTLSSAFAWTDPATSVGNWEEAYDIWLSNGQEIMIWVNTTPGLRSGNGATVCNSERQHRRTELHLPGMARSRRDVCRFVPDVAGERGWSELGGHGAQHQ